MATGVPPSARRRLIAAPKAVSASVSPKNSSTEGTPKRKVLPKGRLASGKSRE